MTNPSSTERTRLEAMVRDPRYWDRQHTEHGNYVAEVTRAFEDAYGESSDQVSGGTVHVRGYTQRRDGRIVQISEYDRASRGGHSGAAARLMLAADNRAEGAAAITARVERGRVIYVLPDGGREIRTGGTRSWRNKNPGNMVYGPFAREHGALGRNGPSAIFPSEEVGLKALDALLRSPPYEKLTLDEVIAKYAPKKDNNPTEKYQDFIRERLNLPGGTPLQNLSPAQMRTLREQIIVFEGWRVGRVTRTDGPHQ